MNNKKVALVAGANQGIGYATAKRFLQEGLAVVLTSKFALNGLTLQLSNQVKKDGILVNTICPGWVRTPMGGMSTS